MLKRIPFPFRFAAKASSHELLGLTSIHQFSGESGLHVPLCCLIDYLGYRLIAMSLLPIGKDTLVYGSGTHELEVAIVVQASS